VEGGIWEGISRVYLTGELLQKVLGRRRLYASSFRGGTATAGGGNLSFVPVAESRSDKKPEKKGALGKKKKNLL